MSAPQLSTVSELLTSGGDGRITAGGPGGANRYGRRPFPDPELIGFGSSTASTISPAAFAAAERWRAGLVRALAASPPGAVHAEFAETVRRELLTGLGLGDMAGLDVILAASGTDLHRIASQLVSAGETNPARVILAAAGETGAGVAAALAGDGPEACEVAPVPVRTCNGEVRDPAAVDAEVARLAAEAARERRRILLVMVDVSKTGLVTPSLDVADQISARFPDVAVLVDACQLRLTGSTLRAYLERGFLVAVTGSKFLGGPAFAGALLVPPGVAARLKTKRLPATPQTLSARGDWPAGWAAREAAPAEANFGLLLRWAAALEELAAFSALPPAQVAAFVARFGRMAAETIADLPALRPVPGAPIRRGLGGAPAWDQLPTIFPFLLAPEGRPFQIAGAEQVDLLMRNALADRLCDRAEAPGPPRLRVELGQPVAYGSPEAGGALRLCLGARVIGRALTSPDEEAAVLDLGRAALAKAAFLAGELARLGLA